MQLSGDRERPLSMQSRVFQRALEAEGARAGGTATGHGRGYQRRVDGRTGLSLIDGGRGYYLCEMDRKAWETEGRTFIPGRNRTLVAAIRTKPCWYALYSTLGLDSITPPPLHWGKDRRASGRPVNWLVILFTIRSGLRDSCCPHFTVNSDTSHHYGAGLG